MMVNNKRAKQPYQTKHTKSFSKAWERYNKSGRYDMNAFSAAMWLVASRNPLPAYYLDHSLSGEYDKYRELHIGGDYLLVYYVDEASRTIVFSDLGTHAELFE